MSRYTGPRLRKMRALGIELPGLSRKSIERRPNPPGVHGGNRRRKLSDHGKQLREKQKLRLNYGLNERPFRRLVKEAKANKAPTGKKILELLERRLDNVLFRAGYAATIPAARQLINHGHIHVNGRQVDIASFRVKVGDVIRPRDKSTNLAIIHESLGSVQLAVPDWIDFDSKKMTTRVTAMPESNSVPFEIDVQLVVEYYAKRL